MPSSPKSEKLTLASVDVLRFQKLEALIMQIVRAFSTSDSIVLDLFSGTNTTTVCAARVELHYVAIEKNEKFISADWACKGCCHFFSLYFACGEAFCCVEGHNFAWKSLCHLP